jgi:hypothetical protein
MGNILGDIVSDPKSTAPKTFISYSWDDDDHRGWVLQLATRLRGYPVTRNSRKLAPE